MRRFYVLNDIFRMTRLNVRLNDRAISRANVDFETKRTWQIARNSTHVVYVHRTNYSSNRSGTQVSPKDRLVEINAREKTIRYEYLRYMPARKRPLLLIKTSLRARNNDQTDGSRSDIKSGPRSSIYAMSRDTPHHIHPRHLEKGTAR